MCGRQVRRGESELGKGRGGGRGTAVEHTFTSPSHGVLNPTCLNCIKLHVKLKGESVRGCV